MSIARIAAKTLGVCLATAAFAVAQSAQEHADPMAVLKKVQDTYRSMKSLRVEGVMSMEMTGQGMQNKMEIPFTMTMVPPDKMRMESKGPMMGMLMVYSGDTIWMYMPQLNKYSKMDKNKFNPQVSAGGPKGLPAYAAVGEQYKNLTENIQSAQTLREEAIQVGGRKVGCYVMKVAMKPVSKRAIEMSFGKSAPDIEQSPKTMWIDKSRFLVLRESSETKMTFPNSKTPMQTKQTITFNKVVVDQPVSDDLFVFTPPQGATEMDLTQFLPKNPPAQQ